MNRIIIFLAFVNQTQIYVKFANESLSFSQKQMTILLNKSVIAVNDQIKNVYSEGELYEKRNYIR